MNRNTIIGLLLIFGIFMGYMYLVTPSEAERRRMQEQADSNERVNLAAKEAREKVREEQHLLELEKEKRKIDSAGGVADSALIEKLALKSRLGVFALASAGDDTSYVLESDLLRINISSRGGKIAGVELKKFKTWDQKPLSLFNPDSARFGFTFSTGTRPINTDELYFKPFFGSALSAGTDTLRVSGADSLVFAMRLYPSDSDTTIDTTRYLEYLYTLKGNDYMLGYKVRFVNLADILSRDTRFLEFKWNSSLSRQERSIRMERMTSGIFYKFLNDDVDDLITDNEVDTLRNQRVHWISYTQQFFSSTLVADGFFADPKIRITAKTEDEGYVKSMLAEADIPFNPSENKDLSMRMFFGPNQFYGLKKYDLDLEQQIPLGWGFFLLAWINIYAVIPVFTFFGNLGWNYGIIILVLTILLKIVLFPIAYKTYKSSAKMRVLKPEVDELNAKFPNKEDAMKKQSAMMDLYKKAGVNPMAGCIPLLLQMPILIAMFRFFPASIELRQQAFLWAKDLSSYDDIYTFPGGFSIPWYGDHISLFALLMTISSIFYTKLNDQMMGSQQTQMPGMKTMMYLMPVMFLFWFNDYSSGLSYYYLLANLLTFAQIFIIRATIDEKKLHAQIEANKKKPVKKSGFQKRLEDMAKKRGYPVKR